LTVKALSLKAGTSRRFNMYMGGGLGLILIIVVIVLLLR